VNINLFSPKRILSFRPIDNLSTGLQTKINKKSSWPQKIPGKRATGVLTPYKALTCAVFLYKKIKKAKFN